MPMMNATDHVQAEMPAATIPPAAPHDAAAPAGYAWQRTTPQRLSVWDERARKMGFPPSSR